MFEHSLSSGTLPNTLTEATISVMLKKDKNPAECSSYRPISLLNVDETDFIRGRNLFSNIRRLINIISAPSTAIKPEVVLSLDAEKAFDGVEWGFLFKLLEKFGFGQTFISWVRLLYASPKARVYTNNHYSSYFSLSRGTRQGCPLSPLLFALIIEPLAIKLRTSACLQGIERDGVKHYVSLYADDLLLYITDPGICSHRIIQTLDDFGTFSGYKINLQKTVCFPINNLAKQLKQGQIPFHLTLNSFRYLGIDIAHSFKDLHNLNFVKLLTKVKADLQKWTKLPCADHKNE